MKGIAQGRFARHRQVVRQRRRPCDAQCAANRGVAIHVHVAVKVHTAGNVQAVTEQPWSIHVKRVLHGRFSVDRQVIRQRRSSRHVQHAGYARIASHSRVACDRNIIAKSRPARNMQAVAEQARCVHVKGVAQRRLARYTKRPPDGGIAIDVQGPVEVSVTRNLDGRTKRGRSVHIEQRVQVDVSRNVQAIPKRCDAGNEQGLAYGDRLHHLQ